MKGSSSLISNSKSNNVSGDGQSPEINNSIPKSSVEAYKQSRKSLLQSNIRKVSSDQNVDQMKPTGKVRSNHSTRKSKRKLIYPSNEKTSLSRETPSNGTPSSMNTPSSAGTPSKSNEKRKMTNSLTKGASIFQNISRSVMSQGKSVSTSAPTKTPSSDYGRSKTKTPMNNQTQKAYKIIKKRKLKLENSAEDDNFRPSDIRKEKNDGKQKIFVKSKRIKTINTLFSYIGCHYPHIRKTIIPICIIHFFVIFVYRAARDMNNLSKFSQKDMYKKLHMYGIVEAVNGTSILDLISHANFLAEFIPSTDLAIIFGAFISIGCIGTRHKLIIQILVISLPIYCFFIAHISCLWYFGIFGIQLSKHLLTLIFQVYLIESVPKYHRVIALVLLEAATAIALVSAHLYITLVPAQFLQVFFQQATIFLIVICYYTALNTYDTMYNLLTLSDFNRVEKSVTRFIEYTNMKIDPSNVVDGMAFQNIEPSDDILKIFVHATKTRLIVYELFICSLVCSLSTKIFTIVSNEISTAASLAMFDKYIITPLAISIAIIFMIPFSIILPKCRIIPLSISSFFLVISYFVFKYTQEHSYTAYMCDGDKHTNIPWYGAILGGVVAGICEMIKVYLEMHLIESVPSIVRLQLLAFCRFFEYLIVGDFGALQDSSINGNMFGMQCLFCVPIGIWLLTPRKEPDIVVYFSEVWSKWQWKKLRNVIIGTEEARMTVPPAPVVK